MLISWMVVIISQCICISVHQVVHFKYTPFFVKNVYINKAEVYINKAEEKNEK